MSTGASLGLGTGALGNLFAEVTDDEASAVLTAATAAGIDLIDTAPHYGRGLAERRIGRWLPSACRRPRLSTKVGRVLRPLRPGEETSSDGFVGADRFAAEPDYSGDGVRRSVEGSLARLGVSRVDMLHMHDLGAQTWGPLHEHHLDAALTSGFAVLRRLKEEGLTHAIGMGVNEVAIVERVWDLVDLDVVLLANRHTLLDQSAWRSGFFERAAARGVRIMLGGVFNSGLLTDPQAPEARFEYQGVPPVTRARALELAQICAAHGVPLGAAALNYCRRTPGVDDVLIGPRSAAELAVALGWWDHPIPDALWDALGIPAGWNAQ